MSNDFEADAEANASWAMKEIGALRRHISELEKSLENARKERDEWQGRWQDEDDAARHAREALQVEREEWRKELEAKDAEVAELKADALAMAHSAEETVKERDEYRAQMLSEGGKFLKEMQRADRLQDELTRLKPSGQVAEDVGAALSLLHSCTAEEFSESAISAAVAGVERLAAKAQCYEAAVADNAALFDFANRVAGRGSQAFWDEWRVLRAQPHPGAALLEELRQARALLHQRPGETLPEAIRRVYAVHEKALVRARNEGLEKAVVYLRAFMPEATIMPNTRNIVLKAAAAIDAMKEPEQ